jgi:serine/threonine protein kinase
MQNSDKKRESSMEKETRVTLDNFEFLDMIGEGAFGNVFMAVKTNTGKFYAIK